MLSCQFNKSGSKLNLSSYNFLHALGPNVASTDQGWPPMIQYPVWNIYKPQVMIDTGKHAHTILSGVE